MNKNIKILIESIFDDEDFDMLNQDLETIDNISNQYVYNYYPKTKNELKLIISRRINEEGYKCNLNDIDVSLITDMSLLFSDKFFNGDISLWDVSNVTNMKYMFESAYYFNSDISLWDVSHVTDMSHMFEKSKFNGDISKWNVSSVTNMSRMFYKSNFNGDISNWNVSNVTNMDSMFWGTTFNKNISKWVLSKDVNTNYMFYDCPLYKYPEKLCHKPVLESIFDDKDFDIENQEQEIIDNISNHTYYNYYPKSKDELQLIINQRILKEGSECNLNDIDTSKITDMSWLFSHSAFNGDISLWDVSNVKDMNSMFYCASYFNNDISKWNISNVTNMAYMFAYTDFNHNISKWKLNYKCNINKMFRGCPLENLLKKLCKK